MRQLNDLSREELVAIVTDLRDLLYLDVDDDRGEILNPDKKWSVDMLETLADILAEHRLSPTEPTSTEDHRPGPDQPPDPQHFINPNPEA